MNKKRIIGTVSLFTLAAALILPGLFAGCSSTKLEQGGAYAPTNQVADLQFYQVDAAYDLAYFALDGLFRFERDNRSALWTISPKIKQTLDSIRKEAWKANLQYHQARDIYKLNPVPANLTPMQTALAKIQQLLATANAVIPKA